MFCFEIPKIALGHKISQHMMPLWSSDMLDVLIKKKNYGQTFYCFLKKRIYFSPDIVQKYLSISWEKKIGIQYM